MIEPQIYRLFIQEISLVNIEMMIEASNHLPSSVIFANKQALSHEKPWVIFSHSPIFSWNFDHDFNYLLNQQNTIIDSSKENPFEYLKKLTSILTLNPLSQSIEHPFVGGWIGYLGYNLNPYAEGPPQSTNKPTQYLPGQMKFYPISIQTQLEQQKSFIVASLDQKDYDQKASIINHFYQTTLKATKKTKSIFQYHDDRPQLVMNETPKDYQNKIGTIKKLIQKGTVYQINYTRNFKTQSNKSSQSIFHHLIKNNPEPYSIFLNFKNPDIILSSPEKHLSIKNGILETRPIKGTKPRDENQTKDDNNKKTLQNSVKDKAELTMIVDVHRNDLGKVCEPHTIQVHENLIIEEHPSIFHMSSRISGHLKKSHHIIDAIKACFPAGSITGAPKYQAMIEIDRLENFSREIYTGSIGYIGLNHWVDLAVCIRGIFKRDQKINFSTGGGIVIDSKEIEEYQETLDKAKPLINAINS